MPHDAPGLVIPPPFIYLPAVLLGWVTNRVWPGAVLPDAIQYTTGGLLIAVSIAIVPFVLREFSKAKTHFDARKAVTVLITTGPFRYSRNPSYVALTLLCVGMAVISDRLLILAWLVPALLVVDVVIVRREERFLEEKFGGTYLDYKARVRRWV